MALGLSHAGKKQGGHYSSQRFVSVVVAAGLVYPLAIGADDVLSQGSRKQLAGRCDRAKTALVVCDVVRQSIVASRYDVWPGH